MPFPSVLPPQHILLSCANFPLILPFPFVTEGSHWKDVGKNVTSVLLSKWTNLGICFLVVFWPILCATDLHCKSCLNWCCSFSLGRYVLVLWTQLLSFKILSQTILNFSLNYPHFYWQQPETWQVHRHLAMLIYVLKLLLELRAPLALWCLVVALALYDILFSSAIVLVLSHELTEHLTAEKFCTVPIFIFLFCRFYMAPVEQLERFAESRD